MPITMKARLAIVGLLCALACTAAQGAWHSVAQVSVSTFTPSCTASSNWLARASGLSPTEETAYDTMICGMVSDGTGCSAWTGFTGAAGTGLDALWIAATNSTTTANLNLCSTSYGLTQVGTVAFSADNGYTGDGTTGYFTTGFVASTAGGNYTLNGASAGMCVTNSSTTPAAVWIMGASNTAVTSTIGILPLDTGGVFQSAVNDLYLQNTANTNVQGFWMTSRTVSTSAEGYKNGASFAPEGANSVALPNEALVLGAINTGSITNFSPWQWAIAFIGGGQSSGNITAIYNRFHAYLVAVGRSGC
jgi:hypothetical protein